MTLAAHRVRDELGHVAIDADAHHVEISVAFADFVRDHGGARLLEDPSVRALGLLDAGGERLPGVRTGRERDPHPEQFEEFVCTNAARFYGGDDPSFFAGTAVDKDVANIQSTKSEAPLH